MTHILVPVDFSDCSRGLVDRADELARRLGTELRLLHITQPPGGSGPDAQERLDAESDDLLRDLSRRTTVPTQVETRHGGPSPTILDAVGDAEMVVIGTHGRTGARRLLLGSVSEYVIRRADVPVVTLRTQHRPECEASSCASCTTHVTPCEDRMRTETTG
ncbi:MAG: universal stress protein [Proteobacteria bacterium]|nr:universal stress protein [Pseudomonadota bacterium]MCP4916199.1 universal stress protein [Pseudomonadota bacterium]